MNQRHHILIAHHHLQLPQPDEELLSEQVLGTVMGNLSHYGYALSAEAWSVLRRCPEAAVRAWWPDIEAVFKAITGDDRKNF